MDFKKATDTLCEPITAADIGAAVERGEQAVRQSRLAPGSAGHRPPPDGWETAVAKLARDRAKRLLRLADQLEGKR